MTKAQIKKWDAVFDTAMTAALGEMGAVPTPEAWYGHRLDTRAGLLWITVRDGRVFTRFHDPDRARKLGIDCNPYSGKWNFLPDRGVPVADAVRWIESQLIAQTRPAPEGGAA